VLALGGRNPLGYYKDEEKSATTFREIDGVRYSIPGDFAQVGADGTIHLLGRGSVVINSGGEKIFPEEVEEALKTHAAVRDAVVVGIPHPTYGEQVVAVVELDPSADAAPGEAELIALVKDQLASYKAPRRVRTVATIGRAANGKVDYKRHRDESIEELGVAAG
jgi:fatty-acyl-CoA synthase